MKFSVTNSRAKAALSAAAAIISPRSTQPVYANALLRAEGDRLHVFAANERMTVSLQVAAEVKEPGRIAVPAKRVAAICSELQGDSVQVVSSGGGARVIMSAATSRFTINSLLADGYTLQAHALSAPSELRVKQSDLAEAIERVSCAMGNDDSRPNLKGMLFEWKGETLTLVATDGRRLVRSALSVPVGGSARFIVPDRAVSFLRSVLGKGAQVLICSDEHSARFDVDPDPSGPFVEKVSITFRLVEGAYPDYHRAIPAEPPIAVVVNREPMLAALSRAALLCSPKFSSVQILFSSEGARITVRNPEMGESDETVPLASMHGEALAICFNPKFLIDNLSTLTFDEVTFRMANSAAPLKIEVGDFYTAVVMPVRLS